MAIAVLDNVLRRVIAILNANPNVWSPIVSGSVGAFPVQNEISAAIFEADEFIVVNGYFQSVNHSLSSPFNTVTPPIVSGDALPIIRGNSMVVEYCQNLGETDELGSNIEEWKKSVVARHFDDVTGAIAAGDFLPSGYFAYFYAVDDGKIYTPAEKLRVTYPKYTRTDALQCQQSEESLLICTTVRLLTKHASPVPFEVYTNESTRGIDALIRDGSYTAQMEANQ